MKTLTKAEEEVMQVLWKLKEGFLREVVDNMPEPKPHQNTVATVLKILTEKQFVGTQSFGRLNRYYPLIKKSEYSKSRIKAIAKKYFDNSFSGLVSSMVKDNNLSIEELELLVKQLKNEKR